MVGGLESSLDKSSDGVAVVVVNYGTAKLTEAAVNSVLQRSHDGRDIEIHVVDNASPEDDAAILTAKHSENGWGDKVRLWLEHENHGFGRGNNLVIEDLLSREQAPKYIFLLNPDAELENEALARLADVLDNDPNVGAAGAGISFPDGTQAVACFRFPSFLGELTSAISFGPLDRLFPKARLALPPELPKGQVDWVAGASVLLRTEALQKTGLFDPDFFLYFEEVELMGRLKDAGYKTLYVPEARVIHIAGAATNVASHHKPKRSPAYLYDSWRMYFEKRHGRTYALATALCKMPAAGLGVLLSKLRGLRSPVPICFFQDHWRLVVRPLLRGETK